MKTSELLLCMNITEAKFTCTADSSSQTKKHLIIEKTPTYLYTPETCLCHISFGKCWLTVCRTDWGWKEVLNVGNTCKIWLTLNTLTPNKTLLLHGWTQDFENVWISQKNSLYPVTLELEAALKPSQVCMIIFWFCFKTSLWLDLVQHQDTVTVSGIASATIVTLYSCWGNTCLGNCGSQFAPFQTEL